MLSRGAQRWVLVARGVWSTVSFLDVLPKREINVMFVYEKIPLQDFDQLLVL